MNTEIYRLRFPVVGMILVATVVAMAREPSEVTMEGRRLICFSHMASHDGLRAEFDRELGLARPASVSGGEGEFICPDGGNYRYGSEGFASSCSVHGIVQIPVKPTPVKRFTLSDLMDGIFGHRGCVGSQKNTCIANLKQLDGAKQQWALDHKKGDEDSPLPSELFGSSLYIKVAPTCPLNGRYYIGSVAELPRCSCEMEGHTL